MRRYETRIEWPTFLTLLGCYAGFAISATWLVAVWLPLAIALMVLIIALHSSLSHEMIHGHPFKNKHLNAALVFPALSFAIPYMRFRDTHLAHHIDQRLTDPYDDPESGYFDPAVLNALPNWAQALLNFNNTLAGRLLLGPLIGQYFFMRNDWRLIKDGDTRVFISWLWHVPAAVLPVWWIATFGEMPLWAYFLAVYAGLSVLKIRTFLEHQAHEQARGRTVIIEDRGLLAFLFLNNNFHSVHHMHPSVAWYDLPALYQSGKERFLQINDGYLFKSYSDVFKRYFWTAKEPVAHPIWRAEDR